jgi:hypothetical protein
MFERAPNFWVPKGPRKGLLLKIAISPTILSWCNRA